MQPVTVVIPVFNRPDLAAACIASCRTHLDPRHALLVVDDASTDPATAPALEKALEGMPNGRLVRNPENLGFLKTCNRAVLELDATDNDILLLNSDTVVTEGFLEEMLAVLYASERHGACSPRSDDATICTVVMKASVTLTPQERFYAWEKLRDFLPRWTQAPTAVGFCMLVRRSLIRRFGLFDEIYGDGYEEENDFCARIGRYGFSAVLANHAFVFHAGHASFGSVREAAQKKRNAAIIAGRYPEFLRAAESYRNYFLPVADHFAESLGRVHARRSILYDLSHLPAAYNGTSEYALSLLRELEPLLSARLDFHILISPEADAFFGISGAFRNVRTLADECSKVYDLVFTPHQPYAATHLALLNRLAVRIAVNMQDMIALRCPALCTADLRHTVETAVRHVDGVLSVSQSGLADFQAYASDALSGRDMALAAVLHGITPPRAAAPADSGQPYAFIVGNAFTHKAIKEAAAQMPSGIRVVTLGGGRLTSGGHPHEEIDALYAGCAVLVFPSQYEGFGLPVLHAAARGKRVIACNTAVVRELRDAFGLEEYLLTFDRFEEIGELVRRAMALPPLSPLPPERRTWKDAARETEAFLLGMLERPVNARALQDRFLALSQLELASWQLIERARYTQRRSVRQRAASGAGRVLAPFPIVKRMATAIASAAGLLPPELQPPKDS